MLIKRFFILLLIGLSFNVSAQELPSVSKSESENMRLMQSFINDLANENKAVDIILSQYLIVEEPSSEIYDYLEVSLEEVRINLLTKNIKDIEYIPYRSMPRKEIQDIDPEGLDTNNMYFLYYRKRQVLAIYVEGNKIGSFTLVSKGNNKAHFVLY